MRLPPLRRPGLPGRDFGARGRHAIRHVCEDGEPDFDRGSDHVAPRGLMPRGRESWDEGVQLLQQIVLEAKRELVTLGHGRTIAESRLRCSVPGGGEPGSGVFAGTRAYKTAHPARTLSHTTQCET
jgi:hypothetical protein